MNTIMLRLASFLLVIGLLMGCASDSNETEGTAPNANQTEESTSSSSSGEEQEEAVVITISIDEGSELILEKEVVIEDGDILMDVLFENFDIEEEGGFITSIEGIAPDEDEKKAWMYSVNGEEAMVGAGEFELSPGDQVSFDLQSWE